MNFTLTIFYENFMLNLILTLTYNFQSHVQWITDKTKQVEQCPTRDLNVKVFFLIHTVKCFEDIWSQLCRLTNNNELLFRVRLLDVHFRLINEFWTIILPSYKHKRHVVYEYGLSINLKLLKRIYPFIKIMK